ncbi:uncharacterized protein LOC128739996 [Sabethes cyaneus]|uniref:uncharacterized protein LOC128739996 n=1 Tax=Sabethes cyaneus TaxID=53552 RepID=UPI00237E2318|nr:uncharacterized protein LOC128739996 [Sabethes cyaneus]
MKKLLLWWSLPFIGFLTNISSTAIQPITEQPERNDLSSLCLASLIRSTKTSFHRQLNLFADSKASAQLEESLLSLIANESLTWNLIHYGKLSNFNHRQLVVWFLADPERFQAGVEAIQRKNVDFRGYFVLVLASGNSLLDAKMVFERFWAIRVTRVVLLLLQKDTDKVTVLGYRPFRASTGCCRCVEPTVVDRCRAGVYELGGKFDELFDNEVRSCYGCPLRVVTFTRRPLIVVENGSNHELTVGGSEGELLKLVAQKMQFTIEVSSPKDGVAWGAIKPNGSADGAVRMLLEGAADLTLGGYIPYPELMRYTSGSATYWQTQFVFVVPEELAAVSSLDRLLKPFQWIVWVNVLVALVVIYGVIVGLNFSSVGYFDCYPILGLFRVIIGDALPKLPKGNFFSFLFIIWLYSTLIIRESYKCFMIGYLTEREPLIDISSLEALVAAGYRLGVTENLKGLLFADSFQYAEKVLILSDDEYREGFERVVRSGQHRIAMITLPEVIVDFNRRHPDNLNYRICDEKVLSFHYSVYFQRSSPLVPPFSTWIDRIVEVGITEKWRRDNLDKRYLASSLNDDRRTVLTNRHLFSGYVFYGIGLLLAAFVFVLEISTERSRLSVAIFSIGRQQREISTGD